MLQHHSPSLDCHEKHILFSASKINSKLMAYSCCSEASPSSSPTRVAISFPAFNRLSSQTYYFVSCLLKQLRTHGLLVLPHHSPSIDCNDKHYFVFCLQKELRTHGLFVLLHHSSTIDCHNKQIFGLQK